MKNILIGLLIAAIAFILFFNGCEKAPEKPIPRRPNIDSIEKEQLKRDLEVMTAKFITKGADSIAYQAVHHWHTAKRDTHYVNREHLVFIGDSMRTADSMAIVARDNEICALEGSVFNLKNLNSAKDTLLVIVRDSVKMEHCKFIKQRRQKWGIMALWGVREAAGALSR